MRAIKPPRLRPGDLIGFIAPAGPVLNPGAIETSTRYVESLGYRVKHGEHIEKKDGYLAGTDEQRASDFNNMFADPEVRAVFAVRGGYGTPRLLRLVDYTLVRRHPKIFVGFSDITALQLAIWCRAKLITFSGPMPAVEFAKGKPDSFTEENFWQTVTSTKKPAPFPAEVQQPGVTTGVLLGGNLSMLVSLLATPFCPSFAGAILLLEDVGEQPYRIDRMFTQLRNAGVLDRVKALLLGQFTGAEPKDAKPTLPLPEVFRRLTEAFPGPVFRNLPYGHIPRRFTAPLGCRVRADGVAGTLQFLAAAVE